MKTETNIFIKDTDVKVEDIQLANLTEDERNFIKSYIEFTRYIQEIDQLFRIYRVNLKNMLYFYSLNNNDMIERRIEFDFEESDDIIINTFVRNYVSSGKTLTEAIERFMEQNTDKDVCEKFKKECLSKVYDNNFYYRFLVRIRDFSQHGHLPVNVSFDGRYCFNLRQILDTPHFTLNGKIKRELESIEKEIYTEYGDYPQIVFTLSLAEFNFSVIKIYLEFLNTIESILVEYINQINSMLKERPDIIYKSNNCFNGYVLYDIEDENVHCFDPKEDTIKFFEEIKDNVSKIFLDEKEELESLNNSYKKI